MIVNVAPSSSINSPATFPVNRSFNVVGIPNPFLLHCRKTKGSIFPSLLCRKITGTGRIVAAVDMKEAEKKRGLVRIVGIVGEGSFSPLKSAPWLDVMLHTDSQKRSRTRVGSSKNALLLKDPTCTCRHF